MNGSPPSAGAGPEPVVGDVSGTLGSSKPDAVPEESIERSEGEVTPDTIAFADFHSSYVTGYIQLADAKAGVSFAFTSGVLGYLLSSTEFRASLWSSECGGACWLAFAALLFLAVSSFMTFYVILPRRPKGGDDLVYYKSVAGLASAGEFVSKLKSTSHEALSDARIAHCYNLSKVCTKKYEWLHWGMLVGLSGVVFAFIWWAIVV